MVGPAFGEYPFVRCSSCLTGGGCSRVAFWGDGPQTSILIVDCSWLGLGPGGARILREGFAGETLYWPWGIWSLRASFFESLPKKEGFFVFFPRRSRSRRPR